METESEAVMPIEYSETFTLTAGESDVRCTMPPTLVVERMIELATRHANILNLGYARLAPLGVAWVLSRLSFKFDRLPAINETYTVATWVEDWNRMYSDRCFAFTDARGREIGWGRTIWATIDVNTRRAADLTHLGANSIVNRQRVCPIPHQAVHKAVDAPQVRADYTFKLSDLDFNQHVNSVKYVAHIFDLIPLDFYLAHAVSEFEIAYRSECLYGQDVVIHAETINNETTLAEIQREGKRVVTSKITWNKE